MLRVAFASSDQEKVDLHFGASERLVVYDVSPGKAELVSIGEFAMAEMKGVNKHHGLAEDQQGVIPANLLRTVRIALKPLAKTSNEFQKAIQEQLRTFAPSPDEVGPPSDKPPEDKVVAKLEFLTGCSAVYAASIGASSIKRLMAMSVQPVIVDNGRPIPDLLNEISLALHTRDVAWVERARQAGEIPEPLRGHNRVRVDSAPLRHD